MIYETTFGSTLLEHVQTYLAFAKSRGVSYAPGIPKFPKFAASQVANTARRFIRRYKSLYICDLDNMTSMFSHGILAGLHDIIVEYEDSLTVDRPNRVKMLCRVKNRFIDIIYAFRKNEMVTTEAIQWLTDIGFPLTAPSLSHHSIEYSQCVDGAGVVIGLALMMAMDVVVSCICLDPTWPNASEFEALFGEFCDEVDSYDFDDLSTLADEVEKCLK